MSDQSLLDLGQPLLDEVAGVLSRMPAGVITGIADEIDAARHVVFHSAGRNGLMLRAFVMRLYHLGLDAHMVGDMATPPVGPGDLLLVNASTGDIPSGLAHIEAAVATRAWVCVFTAAPGGAASMLGDRSFVLPAQTMLDDLRVCPGILSGIAKFSEHEAD